MISKIRYKVIIFHVFTFFFLYSQPSFSQTVYEPIDSGIYKYLADQASKGIIEFKDEIKPVSRKYIAKKLLELSEKKNLLSNIQYKELEFYKKEFGLEIEMFDSNSTRIKSLTFLKNNNYNRFSLFDYSDNFFTLKIDPILGYSYTSFDDKNNKHLFSGLTLHGYIGKNVGYYFYYRDNSESGTYFDTLSQLNSNRGITIAKRGKDYFEYSDTRGGLSYDWDWGKVTIAKDYITLGNAEKGDVILSDHAPSFPFFSFEVFPVDWLKFKYFHAWLASDIVDSSDAYETLRAGIFRVKDRPKFMALHSISVYPIKGLSFTLGESIIYSEQFEYIYLIPVIFFRLADHYLSNYNNRTGSNAQIFFNISSRNQIPNLHLYSSLFIDDISVTNFFDRAKQRNKLGFTLGVNIVDLPFDNLTFTAEYTRINPYVYTHFIKTLSYENSSYTLGHWIQQNADLLHLTIYYNIARGFNAKVWADFIRKGGEGDIESAQRLPQPEFLFGLRKNVQTYGIELKYEFIHRLNAKLKYEYREHEVETTSNIYSNDKFNELSFSLYYGM